MIKRNELESLLEDICPLAISQAFKDKGHYDNSGGIIIQTNEVSGILFALDLSETAVDNAISLGVNTIITHHPAIYNPITSLSVESVQGNALIKAIRGGLNVYSMHLNLDGADNGIDACLAKGLGAKNPLTLDKVYGENGYGKEFEIDRTDFDEYIKFVKKTFDTERVVFYGNSPVRKIASFCGGGSGDALSYSGNADTIVTSDMPHHVITELVSKGKNVILLTHYASEIYGFKIFYEEIKKQLNGKVSCHFFDDVRYK